MSKRRIFVPEEIVGMKFGALVVVGWERKTSESGYTKVFAKCSCICGSDKLVAYSDLFSERVKSCGKHCHVPKVETKRKRKVLTKAERAKYRNPLRTCWYDMKCRCDKQSNEFYQDYGGRGITYQESWKDFSAFLSDMGEAFEKGLSLDRIDVNGNYTKENCRWVNFDEQNHNRRKQKSCSSKYIGVTWDKNRNRWSATICRNQVHKYLGRFVNELDAVRAYDNASEELYGDRPNKTEP